MKDKTNKLRCTMWALRQCTMRAVHQVTEAHEIAIRTWSRVSRPWKWKHRESQKRSHRIIIVALINTAVYAPKLSLTPTIQFTTSRLHSHDHHQA
jgi:hypothetical protein